MFSLSSNSKGEIFEKELSEKYHNLFTPVLVSSHILRARQCGQIDLCYIRKNQLFVLECKNGGVLSSKQYSRLKRSGDFIGNILDKVVFIKLAFAK